MKSEYTKGEWRAEEIGGADWRYEPIWQVISKFPPFDILVCKLYPTNVKSGDQAQANARLIAQAPKLYEALKEIAILGANPLTTRNEPNETMRLVRALDEMWQLARQAIASVEGK